MTNCNPDTGVRYGVIALNNLDPDTAQWLWDEGTNISEQQAIDEVKAEASAEWDAYVDDAGIAADETDPHMSEDERERFIEARLIDRAGYYDREAYIEAAVERSCQFLEIESPVIEGECEGVKYQISHLGGAPLLWVFEGPLGFANRLCSPCCPNAADLDGGFEPTSLSLSEIHRDHDGFLCYVVPTDWLPGED